MENRKNLIRKLKVLGFAAASMGLLVGCGKKQRLQYQNMTQQEVLDDIDNHGNDLERMDYFLDYYRINKLNRKYLDNFFDDGNNLRSYDELVTLEEFTSKIYGRKITFEDLITATKNNKNLSDNLKSHIYTGIYNLEKNLKENNLEIDLGALYYNLLRLKVNFTKDKNGSIGFFDPYDCSVNLNKGLIDSDEKLVKYFYHEVFGHGIIVAYAKKDGKNILTMNRVPMLYISYMEYNSNVFFLGEKLDEGFADIITSFALNEKIDCNNSKWSYKEESYTLLYYLNIGESNLDDYANKGILRFINRLVAKGYNELLYVIPQYDKVERDKYYDLLYRTLKIHAKIQGYEGKNIKEILKECYDLCLDYDKYIIATDDSFKSIGEISTLKLPLQLQYDSKGEKIEEYYDANGNEVTQSNDFQSKYSIDHIRRKIYSDIDERINNSYNSTQNCKTKSM